MAGDPKIDAKWMGGGARRTLLATVPLEHFGTSPDPFKDPAGFARWNDGLTDRLHEIADGKVGENG